MLALTTGSGACPICFVQNQTNRSSRHLGAIHYFVKRSIFSSTGLTSSSGTSQMSAKGDALFSSPVVEKNKVEPSGERCGSIKVCRC